MGGIQCIGLSAWQDEQARAAVDASPDGVCSKMLLYLLKEDIDDGEYFLNGNVKRFAPDDKMDAGCCVVFAGDGQSITLWLIVFVCVVR